MTCPQCSRDVTSIEDVKVTGLEVQVIFICRHCTAKWRKTFTDPETDIIEKGN